MDFTHAAWLTYKRLYSKIENMSTKGSSIVSKWSVIYTEKQWSSLYVSDPPSQNLSQFHLHEATMVFFTSPLDRMPIQCKVTMSPALCKASTTIYWYPFILGRERNHEGVSFKKDCGDASLGEYNRVIKYYQLSW